MPINTDLRQKYHFRASYLRTYVAHIRSRNFIRFIRVAGIIKNELCHSWTRRPRFNDTCPSIRVRNKLVYPRIFFFARVYAYTSYIANSSLPRDGVRSNSFNITRVLSIHSEKRERASINRNRAEVRYS